MPIVIITHEKVEFPLVRKYLRKDKPFFEQLLNMNNLPQSVTERYVTNLLHNGVNSEFRLDSLTCYPFCAEEQICGYYYKASVIPNVSDMVVGVGPTPQAALKNALSKAGVTFR